MSTLATSVKFLVGKRVYLRPLLREDLSLLMKWMNDQEVMRYLTAAFPQMEQQEEKWLENVANRSGDREGVFMVCLLEGDRPIGTMGIHRISWIDGTATTGACFGEKDCWNKGYGTEAKMLLLHWTFQQLNLRKICSEVIAFNGRSQRYLEKCGYEVEGIRKKQDYVDGKHHDRILVAVFKQDFMRLWREYRKKHLS